MQIWIHDNKMKKITALNNDVPDMLSYTNSTWHSYLDQATSTFDFTIPKFSNGELHEDLKLINDECFVSFYVNGSYQVFYIATLQEDDFNIQLTCNNTNLEYALEYANPFNSSSAQSIQWYLEHMDLLSFAAVEIGNNEIPDRKRTLTFDSQETKMNRLQSLMSKFEAEFEFKVELNRDGTYKRIVINIYQEADDTHHGIGTDRKDVVLYYSNGLKGVQVSSDKTQMFNAGVFDGKDGVNLANVEFSEKNADGVEEFYSRKGDIFVYAPLSMQRYPATMRPDGQDNWIRKDFTTEYENVNDLKAYALRTLKKYAYPLVTYTASVQSGFVSHYTDLKLGDTIRIIDKNFVGGLALEARVSEMIISFDNPANNSFVFTNYRKLDNKPSSALQTRIEQAVESKLPYRIELATTGGVTFKNNEGETIIKPSLYKGNLPWTKDVTWRWALDGVVTVGMQYLARAENIDGTAVLTVSAYVGNNEVATTEITLTDVNDGDDGVGVESIDRYFTSSDQSDGVTIEGAEWSDKPPAPTEDGKYLWAYDEITYTDGTVTTTKPSAVGANFDVDAFRAEIAEDLKDVPNREEFENKIAEELANSKAEIETQIESAKTQAESNAKEYADTINQETTKVAELANAAAGEIKADLVNVKNNLTATSIVANNAQAAVDAAKQDLANVTSDLNTAKQNLANSVDAVNTKVDSAKEELTQAKQDLATVADDLSTAKQDFQNAVSAVDTKATNLQSDLTQAKQDLASQAQQLQEQAGAQSELTNRVSSVEKTANGTKTTVSELSKTVAQNGKDITSVTNRTKTVEDDLANTKTTLTQVQTTANSASQKTATLETGLNGLSAKFENLSVGTTNHFLDSAFETTIQKIGIFQNGNVYTPSIDTIEKYDGYNTLKIVCIDSAGVDNPKITYPALAKLKTVQQGKLPDVVTISFWGKTDTNGMVLYTRLGYTGYEDSQNVTLTTGWKRYIVHVKTSSAATNEWLFKLSKAGTVWIAKPQFEFSAIASDYHSAEEDTSAKVAEYKQTADQNYASLQTTVQNLDGTVQHNKTTAEQTAAGFKTRIESLETYKNGESERANAYFESAKTETAKQLTAERTAIAKDYVAKSTYTSDVTGIRNELSATTSTANATKTNLANYQASNDKVVASLKSSLQTTDGNVSNLQTKVEAVPGQITSAVSSVEGKIPTNVSTRNLILKSNDFANPHKQNGANTEVTSTNEYFVVKSTGYTANAWGGMSWNMSISEMKAGEQFSILMPVYIDSSVPLDNGLAFNIKNHRLNSAAYDYNIPTNKKDQWFNVAITFKAYKDVVLETYPFYVFITKNGLVRIKPPMLVRGNLIPSDYQPAFEDTESDITKLNTTLTQTANGLEQLSTKVTSQGNTINTHTTQISALNTGLSAKVSQTDFNTLSGRVTNAENNITAKANELSSKITSVEGKIPTESGLRNYALKTGGSKSLTGGKLYDLSSAFDDIADNATLIIEFDWRVTAPTSTSKFRINRVIRYSDGTASQWNNVTLSNNGDVATVGGSGHYSGTFKKVAYTSTAVSSRHLDLDQTIDSGTVTISNLSVRVGSLKSDWSPAPEDAVDQISSLSSEIKQTADGMTLLATKTELSTAKNELQSGINTATNKANSAQNTANSAQSTANSNAQTISTHTTQISALNTGLQAKVSQSDFNTLSGRVTTAENNITAKANELSSKITSVEGKIPASISQRNLIQGTSDKWSPFVSITTNNNWLHDLATVTYGDRTGIYAGSTINIFVYLSADEIVLDGSISPRFVMQGMIINKNGTETWTDWDKYHPFYNKWSTNLVSGNNFRVVKISAKVTNDSYSNINGFKIGVRIDGVRTGKFHYRALMVTTGDVFPDYWQPAPEDYDSKLATVQSEFKQTTDSIKASVSSLDNSTVKNSSLTINSDGIVMKAGKSTTDVANAIGSYFAVNQNAINLFSDKINVKGNMIVSGAITSDKIASKSINTAHLNGKIITADVISSNAVTAGAIKAGAVTTDKMSANSINGDRIAAGTLDAAKIKAGSISASQIASGTLTSEQIKAGAIKSINIEASAITSDKIAANSISSDKIVASGITANVIKGGTLQSLNGSTNFELDSGKLFYNNNNTGVFRVQNGASTMGLKFSNTPITVNGTSRILSRAILGGDRNENTLDDGRWDKGGFSGVVVETIKGATPAINEHADAMRVIADNIYFTHTYSADAPNGVSAQGWKMETYSPDSSIAGNVVLKPYGINYRNSDIIVGDIRLDNGDGSWYWMRATINTLKACFGHILNGGTSSQSLNAIRSELSKISGI